MTNNQIRVPVSHVDATWLGMDDPTNPMVINALMLVDGSIDYARLIDTLNRRMIARYSRFSQRIVEGSPPLRQLQWQTDPHFDIRSHVHRLALPDPGKDAELQGLISMLMSEPLDRTRPLWRIYLVENYNGGCAVFGRLHHAIGDGIALMRVVLSFTDLRPDVHRTTAALPQETAAAGRIPQLVRSPFRMTSWAAGSLVSAARLRKTDPIAAQTAVREAASALAASGLVVAAAATNLARLALMPKDQESVYRGDLTPIKGVAWSQPIPLDRVKRIGEGTGSTVNDVLVAAVSGGLRRYWVDATGHNPDQDMRATIPVNLRPPDAPLTLGNKFSIVFLTMPITVPAALDRLAAVRQRMNALKRSAEPLLTYEVLNVLGWLPGPLSRPTSAWFASKASCILTNVPGPRQPVYLAGRRVDRMMFWVPQSRGVGLGISILSYAGDVTVGIMADEALIPHPQHVVRHVEADLAELEQAALP